MICFIFKSHFPQDVKLQFGGSPVGILIDLSIVPFLEMYPGTHQGNDVILFLLATTQASFIGQTRHVRILSNQAKNVILIISAYRKQYYK
jgi:hypothetical protein